MKLISIDIGSDYITVVQGENTANSVMIKTAYRKALKKGSIVEGKINDKSKVIEALQYILQNEKLITKNAAVTINTSNALTREFTVPRGKQKHVEAMVVNEMRNTYMCGSSDVIDFKQIKGDIENIEDKSCKIRAFAIHMDDVSNCRDILTALKLKPYYLDVHSNAIEKLFTLKPKINGLDMSDKGYMVLDFGYSGILAYIYSGYELVGFRFIPIGISDFIQAIISNQVNFKNEEEIDITEIIDFNEEQHSSSQSYNPVIDVMAQCTNELQKIIMYNVSKLPNSILSNIFIYGGGSKMPGIEKNLSFAFNVEAQVITSFSTIKFKDIEKNNDIAHYINAAGALIRLK